MFIVIISRPASRSRLQVAHKKSVTTDDQLEIWETPWSTGNLGLSGWKWIHEQSVCARKWPNARLPRAKQGPGKRSKKNLQPKNGCNFVISRGLTKQQRKWLRACDLDSCRQRKRGAVDDWNGLVCPFLVCLLLELFLKLKEDSLGTTPCTPTRLVNMCLICATWRIRVVHDLFVRDAEQMADSCWYMTASFWDTTPALCDMTPFIGVTYMRCSAHSRAVAAVDAHKCSCRDRYNSIYRHNHIQTDIITVTHIQHHAHYTPTTLALSRSLQTYFGDLSQNQHAQADTDREAGRQVDRHTRACDTRTYADTHTDTSRQVVGVF